MAGKLDTRTLFSEMKSCELYETLQEKTKEGWKGSFASYKKAKGILYYIKNTSGTKYVVADCSQEKFEKTFRIFPDSFKQDKRLKVPVCTYVKTDWVKGNLVMVMTDGRHEWYLDYPRLHARELHLETTPDSFPLLLVRWLTREEIKFKEWDINKRHTLGIDDGSIIIRCMMRIHHSSRRNIRVKRLAEKKEATTSEESDHESFDLPTGVDSILDMFADNFDSIEVEEKFDDLLGDFLMSEDATEEDRFLGMESFNMEAFISRMELNRTLFSFGKTITQLIDLEGGLSERTEEFVAWYKSLK